MGTKLWLGIVFTPSWLRVACIQFARSPGLVRQVYGLPLPVGCINEDSGAIEDSNTLQAALASLPCMNPKQLGLGAVFLVVPQLLCYRTAFTASPALRHAPVDQLIAECVSDLPGDRSSLVVDAYAHEPSIGDHRSVMVVAARRSAIEAYTRLFAGCVWCLGGVTTGEIARFNRWTLQRPDVSARVVLVCTSDVDSRELSVWDRGVLTASDTRYWRQRSRIGGRASTGMQSGPGDNRDMLTRDILTVIEKQSNVGRPVESVLFGGTLRKREDLQLAVSRASGVPYDVSVDRLCASQTGSTNKSLQLESMPKEDNGLYDDAVGATAPKISQFLVRQRRKWNGLYQSYA
jgi:hypothetical protein